jgi:hypothetical protein
MSWPYSPGKKLEKRAEFQGKIKNASRCLTDAHHLRFGGISMAQINLFDKIGLNIDQVSQMTGVKKTTLRYWEKEFSDYLKPERTDSRRRQYSLEEVEKVAVLKQLIEEEKYKSAGVRLKLGLGGGITAVDVAAATAAAENKMMQPQVMPDG